MRVLVVFQRLFFAKTANHCFPVLETAKTRLKTIKSQAVPHKLRFVAA